MKPYQRGDVVIIDVPMLANSHIQAGKRPWVVVQNNVSVISFLLPALSFP